MPELRHGHIKVYLYGDSGPPSGPMMSCHLSHYSIGLLGRGIGLSQGLYLYIGQHNTEKRGQTSMARVGFKPTVPGTKRHKAHASERAATADPVFCIVHKDKAKFGQKFIDKVGLDMT
ncbi:hypothetical protein L798_05557 [Zootermopsis nevadensis]|uniref:Uncharacterized protein n=1 Tax=Zootermopsis nevadensis TaxID=136037 RepID=A0A067RKR1_ZOONE|nr:hypothetical protein L798_05557 [Zootermopsis nevadensis]